MNKSVRGYLKQSRGYWHMQISYYENDKRKVKNITTGLKVQNNKRKAEQILSQKLVELERSYQNNAIDSIDMTFSQCLDKWLEDKRQEISKTTYDNYFLIIKNHIKPYFKNKKLSDIKPKDIDSYCHNELKKVVHSSVTKHLNLMKQAIDYAVLKEYIDRNPAIIVKLPKNKKKADDKVILSLSEAKRMLGVMKRERIYPIIILTLYYGMRKEEVLGLTWNDIDFENHNYTINNTITQSAKGSIRFNNSTKTVSSNRTLPMNTDIEDILRAVKKEQEHSKKTLRSAYVGNDYNLVFTNKEGKMYRPDYITKKFQKLLKQYNFEKMRFHDLRHSCATIMRDRGIPIDNISKWLGHSDVSTTTDIYIHKDKDINYTTGETMKDIFKVS